MFKEKNKISLAMILCIMYSSVYYNQNKNKIFFSGHYSIPKIFILLACFEHTRFICVFCFVLLFHFLKPHTITFHKMLPFEMNEK